MSLHHAAQHLSAQGRGPDETLVHMSNKEVAGLQAIAKMHGGSLTVNPKTGLPEAGFLDSIMPTLVGGAMTFFSDGAISPAMAAGIMGLGTAANTGNLGKGLMAGLGAYGGGDMMQNALGSGYGELGRQAVEGATVPQAINPLDANAWGSADTTGVAANQVSDAQVQQQVADKMAGATKYDQLAAFGQNPSLSGVGGLSTVGMATAPALADMLQPKGVAPTQGRDQMIRPYTFAANSQVSGDTVGGKPMLGTKYTPGQDTSERQWFNPVYTAQTPYKAAAGGLMSLAAGGPVEQMSNQNAIGANTQYPMADTHTNAFATPYQTPVSQNMLSGSSDTNVDPYTGEERFAGGGEISNLGGYSDGGRLLKGPGDGMSDNIPAQIGEKQPARLADGEFVVPADVVSHLGNGSTDAGAKHLYKMMDKVRAARTGNPKQGKQINASKFVPA